MAMTALPADFVYAAAYRWIEEFYASEQKAQDAYVKKRCDEDGLSRFDALDAWYGVSIPFGQQSPRRAWRKVAQPSFKIVADLSTVAQAAMTFANNPADSTVLVTAEDLRALERFLPTSSAKEG